MFLSGRVMYYCVVNEFERKKSGHSLERLMKTITYIHTHTYIYTYIPWIHKCLIKTVGCGVNCKYTYKNLQCKILQTFYKNIINNLYT